jgi:hypothetical protein
VQKHAQKPPSKICSLSRALYFKECAMEDVKDLWLKFNEYSNKLTIALGRTSNIVGEYAEHLAHKHYGGRLLDISGASADLEAPDGTLYQVKSRKIKGSPSTQLNVIRSWDFDFLVVILFESSGAIKKAVQVPVEVAKEYGASNNHQNGWVITTSQKFLNDHRSTDVTVSLSVLNK